MDNPFVFDDRYTILLNPSLIDPWNVRDILFHNVARPVVNASYAFDRCLWGFSSFGFHLTNFILHVVAIGLFYGWCTRALSDGARQGSDLAPASIRLRMPVGREWAAFFAAAVFGLHPAMTQAVEYVSARSELLAACGILVSLMFARRAIVASSRSAAAIAALAGALAIGSSGSAAALPILVLAYDAWVLRDPGWRRRWWRVYAPATAAVGLAAAWWLSAIVSADRVPARNLVQNFLTQTVVIWRYVGLLLVPAGQSIVHDVRWIVTPVDPIALTAVGGAIVALVLAARIRRSAPLVAFGIVWFFAVLLPTAVAPLREPMMEHRLYVPSLGLLLAAATALSRPLAMHRTVRLVALATVLVLAAVTRARNLAWSEPVRIWEEAVQRAPAAWQAHFEYGESLREAGKCDRALPEYDAALRLNPGLDAARAQRSVCERRRDR